MHRALIYSLVLLLNFVATLPVRAQLIGDPASNDQVSSPHKGHASFSNNRRFKSDPGEPLLPGLAPFYHGVASGDPLADRVIIWTRVTPETLDDTPIEVDWAVTTDPAMTDTITSGSFTTGSERDFTVKVDVTGLRSGSTYYYGFSALGGGSLIGKTKTTPQAADADHLKFGVVSCSNYQAGYFNAYGLLADRTDLDAIIHLGDYIYEYGNFSYGNDSIWDQRIVAPDTEIVSLGDYRARYGTYRLDSNLIHAHQQHPIISVWDDHEAANDSYQDGALNHQPEFEGSWVDRKDRARRAYFEWMPIRDTGNRSIYRAISYGDIAELIMLDTRLEGRDEQLTSVLHPDLLAADRSLLGERQREWFLDRLSSSRAKWKIVGQQVIFSEFNIGWVAGGGEGSYFGLESLFLDIWDGYPAERLRVVEHLKANEIDNVVLLTGDFHSSFAFEVAVPANTVAFQEVPGADDLPVYQPTNYEPATGAGAVAVEFATPSITAANFDERAGPAVSGSLEAQLNAPLLASDGTEFGNPNPHMKYADLDRHGYFILDVRPEAVQADYYYTDVLSPRLKEAFGTGLFSLRDTNQLVVTEVPARPKLIQDTPAPDPIISSTRAPAALRVLSTFPNPATNIIQVQFGVLKSDKITISVLDATGRLVIPFREVDYTTGLYTHRIDVANLPAGSYYLKLSTAEGTTVQPFLRQ